MLPKLSDNLRRLVRPSLHYGWVIFSLSVLNLIVEGGLKSTVPVLYVALRDSFQWSATATSGVFALVGLVSALCAPLLGRLLDSWGPRYLFPVGGLLIMLGWCSSSFVTTLWPLLLCYSVVATIGENSIASFTTTATLSPWFPRTRGRMLGLADAGNPLGTVLFLPLAQWLISTIGWRGAFRLLGVVFFLLVAPANFVLQRRPPSRAVARDQAETRAAVSPASRAPTLPIRSTGHAVVPHPQGPLWRQPAVWFLVLARLWATLGSHLTSVHLVAFFVAAGYDPLLAAATIAAVGCLSVVGRPLSGALSDRLGREVMYTLGLGMYISALLLLLLLGDGQRWWPLLLYVGLSGLSDGISGLVIGAKAGDLFPATGLGRVMGWVQMGRGLGIMAGPLLGGLLFDQYGTYQTAFLLAVTLLIVAVGCMWVVYWIAPVEA
ncbi:MAG: MFS transporter [Candidatus Tectomicrobia bacterium]|uniref:MFS transporter n=1 Tax=Tectimicrobiota bacterium TaxID=2528274 RepID=A0A937VZU6_UNCTE|nr:MFS transporter [Candidatus Tectomicrobia bacterium]